jgi:hypothetical protein
MTGLPPPAAPVMAAYDTWAYEFNLLSMSDDNDKLKEKHI